jgi:hypothetical protein
MSTAARYRESNAVLEAALAAPARRATASFEMMKSVEYWYRKTDGILPSYSEETRPSAIMPTTNLTEPRKYLNPRFRAEVNLNYNIYTNRTHTTGRHQFPPHIAHCPSDCSLKTNHLHFWKIFVTFCEKYMTLVRGTVKFRREQNSFLFQSNTAIH